MPGDFAVQPVAVDLDSLARGIQPELCMSSHVPQSHTATEQWQSFELRMRHRRVQRCVLRATVALEEGLLEQAREAIDEAARLEPDDDSVRQLTAAIAAAEAHPPVTAAIAAAEAHPPITAAVAAAEAHPRGVVVAAPADIPIAEPAAAAEVNLGEISLAHSEADDTAASDPMVERRPHRWLAVAALLVLAAGFGGWVWGRAFVQIQRFVSPAAAVTSAPAGVTAATGAAGPTVEEPAPPASAPPAVPDPMPETPATEPAANAAPPEEVTLRTDVIRPDVQATPTTGRDAAAPPGGARSTPAATVPAPGRTIAPEPIANASTATNPAPPPIRVADEPPAQPARPLAEVSLPPATALPDALPTSAAIPAAPAIDPPPPSRAPVETAAASAASAAAARSASDERSIRAVLGRYEAAYNRLDARAAGSVWPSVDQRALARAFQGLDSQTISLGRCDVQLNGASAHANCSGTAQWTPKVGSGTQTAARRWQFALKNTGTDWVIASASVR